MHSIESTPRVPVCPNCHERLSKAQDGLRCEQCSSLFRRNEYGFVELTLDDALYEIDSTTQDFAQTQQFCGARVYEEYLRPLLFRERFERVLDVGCGIGKAVSMLVEDGYDAYGIDLPNLSKFWTQEDNDPSRFFCCDAGHLPFPNDFFDVVYSLGVMEHIGTLDGHQDLSDDYWESRQRYADELLRVTKLSGRILIAFPNKSFPIDVQHKPRNNSPRAKRSRLGDYILRLRSHLFERTSLNIHPVWGKYHLLSYSETRRLFRDIGGARTLEPLPLKGYFGFSRLESGLLRPFKKLAEAYVNNLPKFARASFLNPYVLVQIRK